MATISEEGSMRAAMAALRTNGGFEVILRLPGQAVSGSDAEQLGLATPQFQDVPVGPAVWRRVGVDRALLLVASAVADLVGAKGFGSAESLLQSAVGVVVGDVLYGITKAEPVMVNGVPCAYRLALQAPVWS